MENLIDKLEFGNVKQLRKNLMIVSATGIVISQLVKYSEGDVSFFGFTIPDNNLPLLNKLIWWIVLYFFVALVVRYFDDEFQKFYKRKMKFIEVTHTVTFKAGNPQMDIDMAKFHMKVEGWDMLRKALVSFLDLIVPLGLGIIALVMTWAF